MFFNLKGDLAHCCFNYFKVMDICYVPIRRYLLLFLQQTDKNEN